MVIIYHEPNASIYQGHAPYILRELPAESADMCMTSPPYWGLRTYKTEPQIWDSEDGCLHEWGDLIPNPMAKSGKHGPGSVIGAKEAEHAVRKECNQGNFCLKCNAWRGELGLEPTIELYISHLIQIFNEVKRVLKKTGTCWVVIDDSYASGKGTCFNPGGGKGSFSTHGDRKDSGIYPLDRGNVALLKAEGLLPKSLCLIPQRFAIAMVEQGWILRNDICWNKPNPMPESVKDRFTGSWEHLFFFVKHKKYWFEQQFERGLMVAGDSSGNDQLDTRITHGIGSSNSGINEAKRKLAIELATIGYSTRNKRDVWEICTEASDYDFCLNCDTYFTGKRRSSIQTVIIDEKPKKKCPVCGSTEDWLAHFATFPEKLCEVPIISGCPDAICKKCGKAREKITEGEKYSLRPRSRPVGDARGKSASDFRAVGQPQQGCQCVTTKVLGYTDCGCNAGFESGIVLDPFCGSGTALAAAKKLGRKGIGIDISPDYCKLAVKRIQGISMPMELNLRVV